MNFVKQLVDHPTLEPVYRTELTVRLLHELTKGPLDFEKLVKAAEGAYPSDVMATLRWLEAEGRVFLSQSGLWARLLDDLPANEDSTSVAGLIQVSDGLPEPHPLDFDWRFTDNTLADLMARLDASADERIAVLGAPTLYKYLADSGATTSLFDKNPHVVQHFKAAGYQSVVEADLLQFPDFGAQFQWAVADPPWYTEHYEAFLDAASNLLVRGGKLLLSVLPRLTRPSASSDRFRVLEYAASLGFDLVEVHQGVLHYASPPFEIEALRADGLVIGDWRTGDLFSFALSSRKLHPVRRFNEPKREEHWKSVQLGKTTIKIGLERRTEAEPFSYQVVSPTGDMRLRSVSRRSPVRSRINLWTSRNIALEVSKPIALAEVLDTICNGESPGLALARIAYEYHFADSETEKLRKVLEFLLHDAGLTWND